jgi:predicted solute-binding protein
MTMRKIAVALAATAALLGTVSLDARPRLTPVERLDKLLEGRVPGKPVSCISNFETRDMQVLDKTAIVYGSGSTIWVNVPKNARDLDDDDIMVTRTSGSQLCDLDIVHTVDRSSHMTTGFLSLGKFVPYKRDPRVAAAH